MPAAPGAVDLLADLSLPGRWLRQWGERPAWPQLCDVDGTWISSLELEERTRDAANRLLGTGLVPGDRIILSAETSASLVVAYIAALRAGLLVVPLNTAYTEAEVARIVADARPAAAAVDDETRADWIRKAAGDGVRVFGIELRLPAAPEAELDRARTDDGALLVYTSGTTGRPKGARLTHGNLLASATGVGAAWRWRQEDSLLLALPLFHLHGLGVGVNGTLSAGATMILRPRFEVEDIASRCSGGEPTLFFGVPAMYQRLAAAGRAGDLAPLRLIVSGSAPLDPTLAAAVAEAAGQMPLERYGMTETVMLTGNPYDGPRKPGTVGVPFPGVETRFGEGGEIEVRGPNVIDCYYEQPEATAESFTDDGWFRTGDLGEHDGDGYLRIVGRSKDLIITGGYNVHPREVEEALLTYPGVVEAAVVGRPSERWGEEVTAFVVSSAGHDVDELRTHAARLLAPYKVPKTIEFIDELPKNALGKVLRNELR
jgi:malonyl-CoA/methylmalonyl-CoA synthetase